PLRHWQAERRRRRRLLIVDEAHNLEAQLAGVYTAGFPPAEMRAWFGGPLARLASADDYRALLGEHLDRLETRRAAIWRELEALRPPELAADLFLRLPPSRAEQELIAQRDNLESALARVHFFLDADAEEWIVRYPQIGRAHV